MGKEQKVNCVNNQRQKADVYSPALVIFKLQEEKRGGRITARSTPAHLFHSYSERLIKVSGRRHRELETIRSGNRVDINLNPWISGLHLLVFWLLSVRSSVPAAPP